jgi:hypothetical protein
MCGAAYADWIDTYSARYKAMEEGERQALALKEALLAEAPDLKPYELWRSLWGDLSLREKASRAMAVIEALYPEGDPSRWEEVGGFFLPQEVPKSLVALDAVFVAAQSLAQLDDEGSPWLARSLLIDLSRSRWARHHFMRTAPKEYPSIVRAIDAVTGLPPVGGWPMGEIEGELPLARPVHGWITIATAMSEEMLFLDASGRPTGNHGPYAWDRRRGRIYNVNFGRDDGAEWDG